jgi:hemerythrin-like domain-containing protein
MARTSTTASRTGSKRTGKAAGKTTQRRSASKRGASDALSILHDDHKRVQKLFKQFEKADHEDIAALREIAEQTCAELELHAALEEEVFYPALREALNEADLELVEEAHIEHDSAKQLIAQLRALQPGDAKYAATFTVLGEYVNHHIDEEEDELFKRAKRAKLDVEALGETMQERRSQMQGSANDGSQDRENGEQRSDEEDRARAPREIPVKQMDIEDEADMEPARPAARRGSRSERGAR